MDQATYTEQMLRLILDEIKQLEGRFDQFKNDYTQAKRIEKFNEIMDCIYEYIENDEPNANKPRLCYDIGQLFISICIKKLPRERILSIWNKIFPNHNIENILDECQGFCYQDNDHHVLVGINDVGCKQTLDRFQQYIYSKVDMMKLICELSVTELAEIQPEINEVMYQPIV